jgi:hypothetical protein
MIRELEDAITDRLEVRVANARRRLDRKRADRAERTRRRAYGLAARHAAKLARSTHSTHEGDDRS